MTEAELNAALRDAPTNAAAVELITAYFEQHGLSFGHGTDNAGDEAYWLVRHLTGWRDDRWHAPPDAALAAAGAELAGRRVRERQPLAYLVGEAYFAGLAFDVDEHVLVPRSPLAELIEAGLAPWCRLEPGDRVLDVGTGSGCIAVACAVHCDGVVVDATDVSPAALAVAARNVARHGVGARVTLFEADLFPPTDTRYRAIVSNPPYVPGDDVARLPAEYRHEPRIALDGGPSGLEIPERLLAGAAQRLTDDGVLIVELGVVADAFAARHPQLPVVWLEFERGGEGVFAIGAAELADHTT